LELDMSECVVEGAADELTAAVIDAPPFRPFGWAWAWRTLWLRKWQLLAVFGLTITVYGAGLVLPICTQRAVDLIAAGNAGLPLVGLGLGAIVAIAAEAVLMSTREKVVISLLAFLERRISRRAFLHLMRRRIDLGVTQAGEVLNRFQQASKIPTFLLRLLPRVVFDAGNAVVSLLLMFYYDALMASWCWLPRCYRHSSCATGLPRSTCWPSGISRPSASGRACCPKA
jgi:ABC-type bacteriocin/lantibiotic exporter with double-glycine peptidase domain